MKRVWNLFWGSKAEVFNLTGCTPLAPRVQQEATDCCKGLLEASHFLHKGEWGNYFPRLFLPDGPRHELSAKCMQGCLNVALLGSSKGGVSGMFVGAPSTSFTWEAKSLFSNDLVALQRNRHTWLVKSPTILHRLDGLQVWLWRWVNKLIIACWCWCNSLFFTFIKNYGNHTIIIILNG